MTVFKYTTLLLTAVLFFMQCQPKLVKQAPVVTPAVQTLPDSALVTVKQENVRRFPNGTVLGKIRKGEKIFIDRRMVNWVQFHSAKYDSAFIWAPSVGFKYINLYSPFTYYDTTTSQFYSLKYFKKLFGSGGIQTQQLPTEYELFFGDLGLGGHQDVVLEGVTESTEQVKHGVTLFVEPVTNHLLRVRVDFFRPVRGMNAAAKKCGFPALAPSEENHGHIIWTKDTLVPGLLIDLERKEWDSAWFSGIWFKKK